MKAVISSVLAVCLLHLTSVTRGQEVSDATPPKMAVKSPAEFEFAGGSLADFIKTVKQSFGLDLEQVGTVPQEMLNSVRVPKMRLKGRTHKPPGLPRTMTPNVHFAEVLELYNQASSDGDSSLGRWITRLTGDGEPGLIMLVQPSTRGGESEFSVRAFSFPQRSPEQAEKLRKVKDLIAEERVGLSQVLMERRQPGLTQADIQGEVNNHSDAEIIVATGGKVFVEMASAIIQAVKDHKDVSDIPIPKKSEQSAK